MPFSARQGFIGASNVVVDGAFPDYPIKPTRLQYANYLANLSANAATTIEGNIRTRPYGQVRGSMHPMPDGNIYFIPGRFGTSRRCSANLDIQVRTYGSYNPSSNTFIVNEVDRNASEVVVNFSGRSVVAGDNYKVYKADQQVIRRLDLSHWNHAQGNVQTDCPPLANLDPVFPDPPGIANLTAGYDADVGSLPVATTGALTQYRDGLRLPNGDFLWIPYNNNSTLARWSGVEDINGFRAGTFTTSQDQELIGACLAPNGKVYIAPNRGREVVVYDYTSNSTSTIAVTGPDSDSYANNGVQLFTCAVIDNTGNVLLGPDEPRYFGHIDTRTDTFSVKYYANVLNTANIGSFAPGYRHATLGPNGNTFFLPSTLSGNESSKIIELRGSTNVAKVLFDMNTIANTQSGGSVPFVAHRMLGSAYTDNGNIYAIYGQVFDGTPSRYDQVYWPPGNTLVINTNANTSLVSGNTHFTYRMSPVGQGAQKGSISA